MLLLDSNRLCMWIYVQATRNKGTHRERGRERERDGDTKKAIFITVQVLKSLSLSILSVQYIQYEIKFSLFSINSQKNVPDSSFLLWNTKHTQKPISTTSQFSFFALWRREEEKKNERKSRERQEEKERDEMRCVCTSLFGKYTILCFPHLSPSYTMHIY